MTHPSLGLLINFSQQGRSKQAVVTYSSAEYTSTRIEQAATYIVHITQYARGKVRTLHCKKKPRPTVQVPRNTTYHTVKDPAA